MSRGGHRVVYARSRVRRALIYFQARNSTEGQWAVCWPQTRAFRVRLSTPRCLVFWVLEFFGGNPP